MMSADLPLSRPLLALCTAFGIAALTGCTATDLASDPTLLRAAAEIDADDPELPETVADLPADAERADAQTTAALPQEQADFVPAAYAGPTPQAVSAAEPPAIRRPVAARSPELDALIARYAAHHGIPESLLRRVVNRESTFNPAARNGPYWGLMQILPQTARTMGYRGSPEGLLDAETNLIYAGKYLRGAYLTAGGDHDRAVRFYSRGYYYDAKRAGLLEETGLKPSRTRLPSGDAPRDVAAAETTETMPAFAPSR